MKKWNFAVGPGLILRYKGNRIEKRHFETGEWMPWEGIDAMKALSEDTTPVSDEDAEKFFKAFQERRSAQSND